MGTLYEKILAAQSGMRSEMEAYFEIIKEKMDSLEKLERLLDASIQDKEYALKANRYWLERQKEIVLLDIEIYKKEQQLNSIDTDGDRQLINTLKQQLVDMHDRMRTELSSVAELTAQKCEAKYEKQLEEAIANNDGQYRLLVSKLNKTIKENGELILKLDELTKADNNA